MKKSELRKLIESKIKIHLNEEMNYQDLDLESICQKASKKFKSKWEYNLTQRSITGTLFQAHSEANEPMGGFLLKSDADEMIEIFKKRSIESFIWPDDAKKFGVKMDEITFQRTEIFDLLKRYPDLKP
jgi:hypothetical protein